MMNLSIDIPLSLHQATVIHANKYSETHGGAFNLPVSSRLYTDVVFRLNNTNEDWPLYINNLDLPIYTSQEVTVVASNNNVLAFIDMQTKYYYFTTRDFSRKLNLGLSFFWVWVIGIMGGVLVYLLQNQVTTGWIFVPFAIAWIVYTIQKWILNNQVKRKINDFLI